MKKRKQKNSAAAPGRPRRSRPGPAQSAGESIADRLVHVRRSFAGERGQARFARQLGLTPSTYANYEKARTPPPQLLVRVADLTGADLKWLLTGRPPAAGAAQAGQPPWSADPQHRAILERAAGLLASRPANLAALAAFLDLLDEKTRLEQQLGLTPAAGQPAPPVNAGTAPDARPGPVTPPAGPAERHAPPVGAGTTPESRPGLVSHPAGPARLGRWVPVFGRAAAGLARFWSELTGSVEPAEEPADLDRLIFQAAQWSDSDSRLAVLDLSAGPSDTQDNRPRPSGRGRPRTDVHVRLVQLSEPITAYQLTEFLDAPALAERYPGLFGLRLDGDSMAPMFEHGTIVLCCPGEPAQPGKPAVLRLAGQIGLTCKIYRPAGPMVRLVPANDQYPVQEFPAGQLDWALAVLGSVRLD